MKLIKVSDDVHERLEQDKVHFTKTIGFNFSFSQTIREYQKLLNILQDQVDKKPPLKNNPRLPEGEQ